MSASQPAKLSEPDTLNTLVLWYNFYIMYKFEFDEAKSLANLAKHGIDFIDAQRLWEDSSLVEIQAKSSDESRFLVIGIIDSKFWSAVITYRGEIIRIISVRRSRQSEVELYEG
jgi:uncharacterized DUF497 family protein